MFKVPTTWSLERSVSTIGVAIALIVVALSAFDASALPSCANLQKRWYSHYITDVGVSWDTSTFVCDDKSKGKLKGAEAIIALSLYDLETAKIPKVKSGNRPNFYTIVKRDIEELTFSADCRPRVLAKTNGSTITLCQDFLKDSREDRASTLVHEARHTEYDDPRHVICNGGKYSDQSQGCDETFHNGLWSGSGYNADVYFYFWSLKKGAKNELSRSVMQGMINSMVPDRFNVISPKVARQWRGK